MNWDRVEAARTRARRLFWVAGFAIAVPVVLWIASPAWTEPRFGPEPPLWAMLAPIAIGIGGVLFGLVWMWWLYKAPTKHEGARWRYRDR